MDTDVRQITSLRTPDPGYEWEPGGKRGGWGTPHAAYNPLSQAAEDGPRADAEPTAELPTLTPGRSRMPTSCHHCGSGFLKTQPPLGRDRFGMVTCDTCGRQLCWLLPALPPTSRRLPSKAPRASASAPTPAPDQSSRPVITSRFRREEGCGPACSVVYGHEPRSHETYGWEVAQMASEPKPTGTVRTGCLTVDFDTLDITVNGQLVKATPVETGMLITLARQIGKLVKRFDLIAEVWGRPYAEMRVRRQAGHALNVNLSRLRARLGPAGALIETVPERGLILRRVPPIGCQSGRARARLPRRLAVRRGRTGGLVIARARQAHDGRRSRERQAAGS